MIYETNYEGFIICAEQLNAIYLTELNKRIFKLYKVLAVPALVYGNECWT
jgi:hypothetical protein